MPIPEISKPHTHIHDETAQAYMVNENEDILYSAANTLIQSLNSAEGSKNSLAARLDMALNPDGTLKSNVTAGGEWVNPSIEPTYVSSSSFTVEGDQTDILCLSRRLKITLLTGVLYAEITSTSYSSGTGLTTVVITGTGLTANILTLEHGLYTPQATGRGSISPNALKPTNAVSSDTFGDKTPAEFVQAYGFETGDCKISIRVAASDGWIKVDDGTIGDAESGATTRANADCEDLFTYLWDNHTDTVCPVTGGRGASAEDDWTAGKTMQVGTWLGRALGVAGAGSGLTERGVLETLGEEEHTLAMVELPAEGVAFTTGSAGTHAHGLPTPTSGDGHYVLTGGDVGAEYSSESTPSGGAHTHNGTTDDLGDGDAHNNMQPSTFINLFIKL